MIEGHSIVYFGPGKWDGMWRNRHQLMSRFARCNKVMYVEPVIGLRKLMHQMRKGDFSKSEFWKALCQRRVRRVSTNLYIYNSPIFVPVSGRFPLSNLTWWAWKSLLRSTMGRLGFQAPIIWLSMPHMINLPGSFAEKLVVYHVVDEYSAYGNTDAESRKSANVLERKMLQIVDLVVVVSNRLYKTKSVYNKHTYIVPNGVDYESYNRALLSDESPPSDIVRLPRPIIGYSGLISKRLDLDLLEHIAIKHPEWSLVFIGTSDERWCVQQLTRLKQMNNIYFLGLKDVKEVPYYVKEFDVCLIPYVVDKETENSSPLKFYDFMATGKPIVTTDFPTAQEFKDIVYIADSKENCAHRIEEALLEPRNGLFNERRRTASLNTWEHRMNQLSGLLETSLKDKRL